jgi:hypothetical protein
MIFYLHIPKTGGQTLGSRMATAFPRGRAINMLRDFAYPNDSAELDKIATDYDFVEAHIAGPALEKERGFDYLCTVRSPIEAIISEYNHIRREPQNIFYRPATLLSPDDFFLNYGDCFENNQSKIMIGALLTPSGRDLINDESDWLEQNLKPSIDRITWLVPTEKIDDFTLLWQIESGRRIAQSTLNYNVAVPSPDNDRLRQILYKRPELYAVDMQLWLKAQKRYADWRGNILSARGIAAKVSESQNVFSEQGASLHLLDGWHAPERRTDGEWQHWAGPTRTSRISFAKPAGKASLEFRVICFYGVTPQDIEFFDETGSSLATKREPAEVGTYRYSVELPESTQGQVIMRVPDVRSAIQLSDIRDVKRQSVATELWRIKPA